MTENAKSAPTQQSSTPSRTVANKAGDDLQIPVVRTNHYNFDIWHIAVAEGPIMPDDELTKLSETLKLKSVPDMVFNDNIFSISFGNADPNLANPSPKMDKNKPPVFSINFNTEDALGAIEGANYEHVKVASTASWQETRDMAKAPMKDKGNWTFTTRYQGTLTSFSDSSESTNSLVWKPTEAEIDYARLRDRSKPIMKHEDIILYEDELDDNGQAQLRLRFRLMQDCFFILLRFYLRLDDVLVRLVETRLYCYGGEKRIIRESCYREFSWNKAMSHPKIGAAGTGPSNPLFNPDMLTHSLLEDKSLAELLDRDEKKLDELVW